jgi:NAD(P)-dependent dehydrogenase (short-subunit alcohol dehydrogenase family)
MEGLRGTRVLVVGASSGVGRATAVGAVRAGADVVLSARREAALHAAVAEAGGGTAIPADITDPEQCATLAGRCADQLGGLDVVINATGITLLRPIADTSATDWAEVLTTNVVGCHQLIGAVVGCLSANAIVATLSSEAVTRPRAGLGAYTASKAALEASLAAWRHEHAPVRFACVAIGATMPTEVSNDFDRDLLDVMLSDWLGTGMMQTGVMPTDDLAAALLGLVAAVLPFPDVNLEHVLLRSPAAVVGSQAANRPQD